MIFYMVFSEVPAANNQHRF